jgi:hypothetical protein
MVVHTYNPKYLDGGDWEDNSSRPALGVGRRELASWAWWQISVTQNRQEA